MTQDVEIIHKKNTLKQKIIAHSAPPSTSKGFLDPKAIADAQSVIDDNGEAYNTEIKKTLNNLMSSWQNLKITNRQDPIYTSKINEIHRYANHIQDLAAIYKFSVMESFARSLRDFSQHIDTENTRHLKIVQAHLDVMWIAFNENLRDSDHDTAKELKQILAIAIDKYGH